MDSQLSSALEFANYTQTLYNQKKLAEQTFLDACVIYRNAGKFTITIQLIVLCQGYRNRSSVILLDDNNIPIKLDDIGVFAQEIQKSYTAAISTYYDEHQRIISNKDVKGVIDE
tara:strand:+ start:125 stop:466 length:342 start_codon:yes stop_codon:yes gene_type:complete